MSSLLSVDIGSQNIHIVEGAYTKGNIMVDSLNSFPVPTGVFNGEMVVNEDFFIEVLNNAIKSTGSTAKDIILTINASNAAIRDIDLPQSKPKELEQMIKNELYQTYHILPTDIIQYKLIEKVAMDSGQTLNRYRVAAIDEDIVDFYRQAMLKTKLKPIAMDLNFNSIDKLFSMEMEINDRILNGASTMLIDFGAKSTTVYILSKGNPTFYRHLTIGSEQIENIIFNETFTPVSELHDMKEGDINIFAENEMSERYFRFLKQYFYNFNDEIRKIMGFYASRNNNGAIGQAYLFGGGSSLKGLDEYWSSSLNISVEQIKSISKIKLKDQSKSIHNHLNAIGALIRY